MSIDQIDIPEEENQEFSEESTETAPTGKFDKLLGEGGKKYFAHTLNNTVVAPPRMLIAFLENNLNEDGTVNIPVALRPYMGGKEIIG